MIRLDNGGGSVTDISNIPIGDADTYFKWVAPDTLQLWVNGALRQSWTTVAVVPSTNIFNEDGQQIYNEDGSPIFHS